MAKKFGVNRRWVQEWCQQMDKLQKLKKSFICRFGSKDFPSYLLYTFACNFCSRKGGRASIGYRASIGTYTVLLAYCGSLVCDVNYCRMHIQTGNNTKKFMKNHLILDIYYELLRHIIC